ncbi:MAG: TIGR03619 family F420-dependent LLM class oxidoreductase [Alphaproteobacteria bacterium]|nr:TIGR03619 family F420-dependent LLM class oxidoreductase [Alphaproteobacteria bacterium]
MDYGFSLPTGGPLANPDDIRALVERGEALGFGHVLVPDHIIIPKRIGSTYPYSESGRFTGSVVGECLEQLCYLAFVAAISKRLRLLTSVMVLPHRSAVMAAKMLATIDVLSGGRLTVGCGVGWMAEEFAEIGAPPFAERGRVSDEYIAAFRELWTAEAPRFAGQYVNFKDIWFTPKPVQKPGPPIWIGGESDAALRRAARAGDGWYPIGSNPQYPLYTLAMVKAAVERVRRYAAEARRDPATLDLAYWSTWYDEDNARSLASGERYLLTGGAADVAADIQGLGELGFRHVFVNVQVPERARMLARLDRFAAEVMARVGR